MKNKEARLVQHCAGAQGTGGPVVAYERMKSALPFEMEEIRQIGRGGLRIIYSFYRTLSRVKPDLVHIRGLGTEGFYAAVACRLAGVRSIIVSIHGTHRDLKLGRGTIRRRLVLCAENITLALASCIVPVCYAMARRRYLDRHRKKVSLVIPNGVPVYEINRTMRARVRMELGIPEGRFVFISVMRVCHEKGSDLLLEALRLLDTKGFGFSFLLVGAGDRLAYLEQQSFTNLSLVCVGKQLDVQRYLVAADAFVLPSLHENCSNALLEAMAAELPVVVSDVGGNRDIIEKLPAEAFAPSCGRNLARAMEALLAWPAEHLREAGRSGRALVAEEYSLEKMCERWAALYKEMLGVSG